MEDQGNKSSGDLMSSGKVVAEAAMSAFQQKSVESIDKKKVAGASAEFLDSAAAYGKLDDKPVGQYLEKAEVYLKQYSSGTDNRANAVAPAPAAAGDAPKPEAEGARKEPAPTPAAEEGKSSEGFGVDDVMKGAESLMEKKSGGEESGGGGGLFKMAQGFMK